MAHPHRCACRWWFVLWGIGVLLVPCSIGWSKERPPKIDPRQLEGKYRHFYELTYWIMTDKERDVFLRLQNDRMRDRFIELFWRNRDPTPGTPENEFRDELERRFAYVNRYFRFGSIPGWKTDRGRVYMILGPPKSTERFDMDLSVYPVEVWYYYGEGRPGLPAHFAIVFYKRRGTGDYKLYSPVSDGPYELLIHRERFSPTDFEAMYDYLREIHPTLAQVVLSPIPGELPLNFMPSPESELMLARILDFHNLDYDDSYAEKFERYAGMIEIEEANRYIQARLFHYLQWWPDLGYHLWIYAIQPETISVGESDKGVYTVFETVGRLEDADTGRLIYQFSKTFRLNFNNRDALQRIRGGILLQDAIPIVPGRYRFRLLVKNPIGKEFSFWEGHLTVPFLQRDEFYADPPILGYRPEPVEPGMLGPFQIGLYRYITDLKFTFTRREKLYVGGRVYGAQTHEVQVRVEIQRNEIDRPQETLQELLARPTASVVPNTLEWVVPIPTESLPPGYYKATVTLLHRGQPWKQWFLPFTLSPVRALAHPAVSSRMIARSRIAYWDVVAAEQAWKRDMLPVAESWFRRALDRMPGSVPIVARFAEFYLSTDRPGEALQLLAQMNTRNPLIYLLRDVARAQMDGCARMLPRLERYYRQGLRHWRLLRAIGLCYWEMGQREKARPFLQDALTINPEQPDVETLLHQSESASHSSSSSSSR